MRISSRIVSVTDHGKERWMADTPEIDESKAFTKVDGKTVAQPDAVRTLLNQPDYITHAKDDSSFLQCVVAHWLTKIQDFKDKNEASKNTESYETSIERLQRKAERGRISYARAEFKTKWTDEGQSIVFTVTTKRDKAEAGRAWERVFAGVMTEAAKVVSEELVDCGYPAIVFSEEAEAYHRELMAIRRGLKHAKKLKRIDDRRTICYHHRHGFCTPKLSICPCYKNGKCERCV